MSVEKSLLKKAAAEEISAGLRKQSENLEKNMTITQGGVAATEAVLRNLQAVHKRVEDDLDSGTLDPDTYQVVKGYLGQELRLVQRVHNSLREQLPAIKSRVEGMRAAILYAENYGAAQQRNAERIEREELEEDEYREDLAERKQEAQSEEEPGHAGPPGGSVPETVSSEAVAEDAPEVPDVPSCTHCGEAITMHTGSKLCMSCTSYKNRYDKLPPDHVLEARRKKREEAGASNS